jgi:hypothetical protein
MDLHADPFHREVELLLQLFDDALADVAEGSDVIGEHLYADGHGTPSFFNKRHRRWIIFP